jgi:tetratricopeptide (TPR) repeat protein
LKINITFASFVLLSCILFVVPASAERTLSPPDQALREGWKLLLAEKYPLAREKFREVPMEGYGLSDYAVLFTGMSYAREGRLPEAVASYDNLATHDPASPLLPLLAVDLAFLSTVEDNLVVAARWLALAERGRVPDAVRKAREGYVKARLLEAGDPVGAAETHLGNFVSYSAQEGGTLSAERLSARHADGSFSTWNLPVSFYSRFAKALSRAGDIDQARLLYREALRKFPPNDDYYSLVYDFSELLRRQGDTQAARAMLDQAISASPAGRCSEASFLLSRVQWKAGKLAEARRMLDNIATGGICRSAVAERALHLEAWVAEEQGDLPWLTEAFGKLRAASDEAIRQESAFRHAYGLYRMKRFPEAVTAFDAGTRSGNTAVERARHRFWKGRSQEALGQKETAESGYRQVASDADAGIYAIFALGRLGRDPYAMFNAPSSMETLSFAADRETLWGRVLGADWGKGDAEKLLRAERLTRLGMLEYAILEADRIDRGKVRKVVGISEGATAGFFRYLAGDLRGALREADRQPTDPERAGLLEKIQYPLAPEMVGDCDSKKSGIDPLVLHSVIRQESQFAPAILSPAGAVGLMQLMPATASDVARRLGRSRPKRMDLVNPQLNVELGAAYLSRLVRGFDGDYIRAVAAYNAGETAVSRWWERSAGDPATFLETVSYRETRVYVRRVFLNLLQYYRIYRPQMFSRYLAIVPKGAAPTPDAPGTPPAAGRTGPTPAALPSSSGD